MKSILIIFCVFVASFCTGQIKQDSIVTYNLTTPFRPARIQLIMDTSLTNERYVWGDTWKMIYNPIRAGSYEVIVSWLNQKIIMPEIIHVNTGQHLVLNVKLNGPCLYDHPAKYSPCCPYNHTDNIIPIAYGLIMGAVNFEKVHLGGCVMTGCDPHFYCKIHKIDF